MKVNKIGFTLIEILVVTSIIGYLSSFVLASMSAAQAKARDVQRVSDLRQIRNALNMYYNDHGEYPDPTEYGGHQSTYFQSSATSGDQNWEGLEDALAPYMPKLPRDPINNEPVPCFMNGGIGYTYCYFVGSGDYDLVARMEQSESYACPNKDAESNATVPPFSWCTWNGQGMYIDH